MSWFEKNVGNKNGIGTGGVGYVVIPENVEDIGDYVNQCYRNNQLTISAEGYGVISYVKVAQNVMPYIKFPNNEQGKGSLVVWVRESFYNRPIIVAILADNNTPQVEGGGQAHQRQEVQGVSVEFPSQPAVEDVWQFNGGFPQVQVLKLLLHLVNEAVSLFSSVLGTLC